jgi:hypothetical protein
MKTPLFPTSLYLIALPDPMLGPTLCQLPHGWSSSRHAAAAWVMAGGIVDAACQAAGRGGGPYGDLKLACNSGTRCSSVVDDRHGCNIVGLGMDVVVVELVSIVKTLLSDTQLSAKICDSGTPHIPDAKLPLHHLPLLPERVPFLGSFALSTLHCFSRWNHHLLRSCGCLRCRLCFQAPLPALAHAVSLSCSLSVWRGWWWRRWSWLSSITEDP